MQEKQATTSLIFCLEHFVYVSMVWTCGVVLLCVLPTGCGLVI